MLIVDVKLYLTKKPPQNKKQNKTKMFFSNISKTSLCVCEFFTANLPK